MDRKEKAENSLQTIDKNDEEIVENDMNKNVFTLQNTMQVTDDSYAYEGGNAEIINFFETPAETIDPFLDATVAADEYREPVISNAIKESDTDIDK